MNTRTNIVLIVADDLGYGDLGWCNGGLSKTDRLDQLVREGLTLTQHYSGSAVCTPARACLLTGRYPHRTGAIDMRELRGLSRLSLRESTIADIFQHAGYSTGLVGKWHNGTTGAAFHPNRRGFQEFIGFRGGVSDYYNWKLQRNGTVFDGDGRYLTDVLADEAAGFIRRHRHDPFFLKVAFNAPHTPLQAPQEVVAAYEARGFSKEVSTIYAMIEVMDRGVGVILDELTRQGLEENTMVWFTSDNGPDFCLGPERFNLGLAGSKFHVTEGGIRVPGIIRWPARLPGGVTSSAFVHFTDCLPTFCSASGIGIPGDGLPLDGADVLGALEGTSELPSPRRFWQFNRYTPLPDCNAAMRDGDWKLVFPALEHSLDVSIVESKFDREVERYPESFDFVPPGWPDPPREVPPPGRPLLFNLASDPCETTDLAAAEPARVDSMSSQLRAWFEEVEAERRRIPA
jgi:arylsulfatase A-like enzyme